MDRIRPLSAIFYMLDVFPGTDLYRELKRRTPVTDDIWLERIEGILYSDTDPRLTDERMLGFGRRLREAFYRGLPGYAEAVELAERPELYERHADFLSRLAMTFTHGDYSRIESIPRKEEVAETLYRRSLAYAPQPRAFLGLGILLQKRGDYAASLDPLSEGVKRFPEDEDLALCLGISYMNLGDTTRALSCFDRFPGSERSREYAEVCRGRA
jgi:tetratricopeptide (TPR) repeat protein